MKYILLFLCMVSCASNTCSVDPNFAHEKMRVDEQSSNDKKTTVLQELRNLQEDIRPGAQLRCRF